VRAQWFYTSVGGAALIAFLILILAFNPQSSYAKEPFEAPSIDDEDITSLKIQLPLPEEGENYSVKVFEGVTGVKETRIAVKKFGYFLRPAMVQVESRDGRPLQVRIVKKHWKDEVRSGSAASEQFVERFTTAIEFGVVIHGEQGIPFRVALSAGPEIVPKSNLFFEAADALPVEHEAHIVSGVRPAAHSALPALPPISVLISLLLLLKDRAQRRQLLGALMGAVLLLDTTTTSAAGGV